MSLRELESRALPLLKLLGEYQNSLPLEKLSSLTSLQKCNRLPADQSVIDYTVSTAQNCHFSPRRDNSRSSEASRTVTIILKTKIQGVTYSIRGNRIVKGFSCRADGDNDILRVRKGAMIVIFHNIIELTLSKLVEHSLRLDYGVAPTQWWKMEIIDIRQCGDCCAMTHIQYQTSSHHDNNTSYEFELIVASQRSRGRRHNWPKLVTKFIVLFFSLLFYYLIDRLFPTMSLEMDNYMLLYQKGFQKLPQKFLLKKEQFKGRRVILQRTLFLKIFYCFDFMLLMLLYSSTFM
ncbi:hypothetical protein Lal_00019432 [Lupinus albus]|nr:hypothetical protein Lal_00019432 [Lupinus albus]